MTSPKRRPAVDVVVILLTAMVGITLVTSVIGVLILRIVHPQTDVSRGAEVIGNIVTTVVGALVGFIGGRATGRLEQANGSK